MSLNDHPKAFGGTPNSTEKIVKGKQNNPQKKKM